MNCSLCKNVAFHNENVYLRHLKVFHPTVHSYICAYVNCSQQIESLVNLSIHMKKFHKMINKTNNCKSQKSNSRLNQR